MPGRDVSPELARQEVTYSDGFGEDYDIDEALDRLWPQLRAGIEYLRKRDEGVIPDLPMEKRMKFAYIVITDDHEPEILEVFSDEEAANEFVKRYDVYRKSMGEQLRWWAPCYVEKRTLDPEYAFHAAHTQWRCSKNPGEATVCMRNLPSYTQAARMGVVYSLEHCEGELRTDVWAGNEVEAIIKAGQLFEELEKSGKEPLDHEPM